jgi:CHAT domain-containing protein/Tfp pilus assembly protein PilF
MKKYSLFITVLLCSARLAAQQVVATADSFLLNAEYDKAIAVLDRSRNSKDPSLAYLVDNKKAEALTRLGKLEDAENILKNLVSENTRPLFLQAVTKTNLGLLYLHQGRNDLALEALQQALEYFEKENKAGSLEAAQAITCLGLVYNSTGKNAQAEEQLRMALTIRQGLLKPDHELIAASYNDLGLVYLGVDNDKALDYYEKAVAIYERLHGSEHPKIAIANTNIGFVYRDLALYGDAVNNFETALKIWEKVYAQPHPARAFVLFNLGETYMKMGDHKAARAYYDRSLALYKSSYGEKHPDISQVLNAVGNLEITAGQFNNALQHFQQALIANVQGFENKDEAANPELQDFYHGNVLLYSLLLKAQALEARHFGKSLKFSDLELGLETLQRCDTLIDRLRQQSTNESDKISLGVIASEVYADGVRMAYQAAAVAFHKRPYLELAFYFAEKSKSAVLLEAISESEAKSFAGIPAPLLEEEKNLKSAIALTARKLAQKPAAEEEKYLREASFNLNRSYAAFVKKLENEFPGYFNLKFNAASPSIHQLQQLLDNKTALLSYFIDDKNSRLYIFIITSHSFRIIDHALPAAFDKLITGLRNALYFNVMDAYAATARKLEKLLIPGNIPGRIKDLVVLPTGRLSIVPFETLLTKNVRGAKDYRALPYLLNKYTVRYEFSAGLLLQKSKQAAAKAPSIFLCAPITFPDRDNLSALPATESEVKEISQLFTSKKIGSTLFTGQEATEHLVKSSGLKQYSFLHFATHGVVDENAPELSRIFLQSTPEGEDGHLFAGEIYNLEMDANLVTLSACETGLGKISKGEGVIGLSRALVYAGARNIIVSFWSVADESTSALMKTFYQRMLDNPAAGYGNTLREAKLALMRNETYAAPYYWAPFILIGF